MSGPCKTGQFIDGALAERVDTLFKIAGAAVEDRHKEISQAGAQRTANSQRGIFQAKLEKLKELIGKLPPQSYDARVHTRFTIMGPHLARPEWMSSPLRSTMQEGGAQLVRTRLQNAAAAVNENSPTVPRRLPGTDATLPEPVAEAEVAMGGAAGTSGEQVAISAGESSVLSPLSIASREEEEASEGGLADDPTPMREAAAGSKRQRVCTTRFAPPDPSTKAKGAGTKAKAALSKEDAKLQRAAEVEQRKRCREHNVALGLKPDGTAYLRGKYKKHVLPKAAAQAARVAFDGATAQSNADADRLRDENLKLRAELAEKKDTIRELEAAATSHTLAIMAAEAAVHMSYLAKMEAQFHKGAAFASQVASGGIYTYTPPSGAGHT